MPANETLVVTKLSVPIGKDNSTDKRTYQKPAWAEAGAAAISRNKPKITILQWLRDAVVKMTTRVPYNKIKKIWSGGDHELPSNYYLVGVYLQALRSELEVPLESNGSGGSPTRTIPTRKMQNLQH